MYGKINLRTPRTCVIELGKKKFFLLQVAIQYTSTSKKKKKTPLFSKLNKKTKKLIKPKKLKKQ